jgi:hypothetical protein
VDLDSDPTVPISEASLSYLTGISLVLVLKSYYCSSEGVFVSVSRKFVNMSYLVHRQNVLTQNILRANVQGQNVLGTKRPWDKTSRRTKRPWDKTSRGTKLPQGQNVLRDRTSLGQNVQQDKTSSGTKRPVKKRPSIIFIRVTSYT